MSSVASSSKSFTSSSIKDRISITEEFSETVDIKHTPTDNLMIITFCLVKEKEPLVPIPMSVRGTKFITLLVRDFDQSHRLVDQFRYNIMVTIQYYFEAEHKIDDMLITSYYQDIDSVLCNEENPSRDFFTKKHGRYFFYTEEYFEDPTKQPNVEKYILVFSINYTPTLLELRTPQKGDNDIITKHTFIW